MSLLGQHKISEAQGTSRDIDKPITDCDTTVTWRWLLKILCQTYCSVTRSGNDSSMTYFNHLLIFANPLVLSYDVNYTNSRRQK